MAKTIKFNLILDNKSIRTIEDLRENFSIEDVLDLYNNGMLERWLRVRGYFEHLEQIECLETDSNIEQIQQLIKIFDVEADEGKIKEGIAILEYMKQSELVLNEYKKSNYEAQMIIDDYHSGYSAIINDILENKDNMPKIKANIKEIEHNYMGLFHLDYTDLYYNLISEAPLAVFAILMNNTMRNYFISSSHTFQKTDSIHNSIKSYIAKELALKGKIGQELKVYKGDTEAYWKDIEPKEKMFMIISMENGNYVRNSGVFGEELSSTDINYNFTILNGIDYKSKSNYDEFLYMEV